MLDFWLSSLSGYTKILNDEVCTDNFDVDVEFFGYQFYQGRLENTEL